MKESCHNYSRTQHTCDEFSAYVTYHMRNSCHTYAQVISRACEWVPPYIHQDAAHLHLQRPRSALTPTLQHTLQHTATNRNIPQHTNIATQIPQRTNVMSFPPLSHVIAKRPRHVKYIGHDTTLIPHILSSIFDMTWTFCYVKYIWHDVDVLLCQIYLTWRGHFDIKYIWLIPHIFMSSVLYQVRRSTRMMIFPAHITHYSNKSCQICENTLICVIL